MIEFVANLGKYGRRFCIDPETITKIDQAPGNNCRITYLDAEEGKDTKLILEPYAIVSKRVREARMLNCKAEPRSECKVVEQARVLSEENERLRALVARLRDEGLPGSEAQDADEIVEAALKALKG